MPNLKAFFLFVLALILVGCSASAQPDLILGANTVLPEFRGVLQILQQESEVPIVLPATLPEAALPEIDGETQPFYSSVSTSNIDSYELSLDSTETCNGATYCAFGIISGEQLSAESQTVAEIYAFHLDPSYQPIKRSEEQMGPVSLAHSIEGYFVPWVCGASCDTAKVFWEQKGYRYRVGIRMADKATVVEIANSAINNEFQGEAPERTNSSP